jgi:hypothetical protein
MSAAREHRSGGPPALKIVATCGDPDGLRCLAAGLQFPVRRADRSGHPLPGDILLIIEVADTRLAYDRDVKIPPLRPSRYPRGVARRSRRQAFKPNFFGRTNLTYW